MAKRLIIFVPILLLILGGCAVMDVSLLEDALPRERGDWEIEQYYSTGMPIWLYTNSHVAHTNASRSDGSINALLNYMAYSSAVGARVGYSASPNTQIASRVFISGMGMGAGAKLGVKQVLSHATSASVEGEIPRQKFIAI